MLCLGLGTVVVATWAIPSFAGASGHEARKLVGYGHAAVWVPSGWKVRLTTSCRSTRRTIDVGPAVHSNCSMPDFVGPGISIQPLPRTVSPLIGGAGTSLVDGRAHSMVNGVTVYSSSSGTPVTWVVPSLGVKISAWGAGASTIVHSLVRTRDVSYGTAALSLPSRWRVSRSGPCPRRDFISIGLLTEPSDCIGPSGTYVAIFSRSALSTASVKNWSSKKVNGIRIYYWHSISKHPHPPAIAWTVPSLGVRVGAYGKGAIALIHTLHRLGS